jgi:putative PIN family toxin of toxin-antitoxin system
MEAPPESSAPRLPVVLDTNTLLDWRVFQDARAPALWRALETEELRWHATNEMLAELAAVLSRPLGTRWDAGRERTLSDDLLQRVTLSAPPVQQEHRLRCTDADDQKFLDLALHLPARWLVTRDRALLKLKRQAAARGLAILVPERWPGD